MREMQHVLDGWDVPVVATQAHEDIGIGDLYATIEAHRRFLEESGELQRRRAQHRRNELWDLVQYRVRQRLTARAREDPALAGIVAQVMQGELDPHSAAARILDDEEALRRWLAPGNSP
jgi:LAO/AO transport system kinase